MTEAVLQRSIVKALKQAYPDSWWMKVHGSPYSKAGVPDLIGCVAGQFYAFEVKLPGKENTLTKLQRAVIEEIVNAYGVAAMITSVEEALSIVGAHDT